MGGAARSSNPQVFEMLLMADVNMRVEADRRCFEDVEYKRKYVEPVRESLKIESRGVAWEVKLLGSNWGFSLDEIPFEGVVLWQAALD